VRKNGTIARTPETLANRSTAIGILPLCLGWLAIATPLSAQAETPAIGSTRSFNIDPQPLYSALSALAEQSGVQFVYNSALVKGVSSPGVSGRYSLEGALKRLLVGSGVSYYFGAGNTVTLEKTTGLEPQSAATMQAVTVIGKTDLDPDDPYNLSYTRTNTALATKTDTPLMETPASIQVVNKAVLHDQQSYRLQDAIKNVSGVQSYHSYGGEHEQFVMRGFLQSTVNYRNGIRIPFTKFDLANVERVEVIKGASAMMYGFGDPGGLISTVTKQPSSTPYYSVEQRFGSYDFYRTEASATGPVSKEAGLNYRLDMSYLDTGSFRDNMSNDRIFFAPTLSWEATPDTQFTLSYEYFDENNAYDYGIPAIGNQLARIPISRTFVGRSDLRNSTTNNLVDFRIDHRLNDQVKLNAGVVSSQYQKDWQGFYTGRVNETPGSSFGNATRNYWFSPENAESLTAWVNGTFDFETYGVRHKLLLGGEYYNSQLKYQVASGSVDTINIFNPNIPAVSDAQLSQIRNAPFNNVIATENTSKAIYVQDQMTLWDKLHIMGGFRYDWVDRTQDLSWWAPAGKDARNDDVVSPRVGIVYQPVKWLSLFGSFTESFGPANDYDTGGAKLYDLFNAVQFEGGIKTQFFDGKLNASVAYFDLERTQFFQDPSSNLINMQVPVKGGSKGVELDVQGQIYEGLSVIGTYAYTDAKIIDDITAPANVGNRMPFAPSHQGSAWLKYDFNQGFLQGFSLGAGVYASGRRYGDAANSYYDSAYARLDLMAAYKRKLAGVNLTTQVNVNNVNDAEYFILRSRRSNLPTEPLTVMGSIKLEY
jgi:iron complex outermembrane receptor protein